MRSQGNFRGGRVRIINDYTADFDEWRRVAKIAGLKEIAYGSQAVLESISPKRLLAAPLVKQRITREFRGYGPSLKLSRLLRRQRIDNFRKTPFYELVLWEKSGSRGKKRKSITDSPIIIEPTASSGIELDFDKLELLDGFVREHCVAAQRTGDGYAYVPTPFNALPAIAEELAAMYSSLRDKRLLSFGAGADLRDAVFFAHLLEMKVKAVEKDNFISQKAREAYRDIQRFSLSPERIELMAQTDAFDLSWDEIDLIYLFYPVDVKEKPASVEFNGEIVAQNQGNIFSGNACRSIYKFSAFV